MSATLALCLLTSGLFSGDAPRGTETARRPDEAETLTQTYDLASLFVKSNDDPDAQWFVPYIDLTLGDKTSEYVESLKVDDDHFMDLALTLLEEEFLYEGRDIRVQDGELVVTGPDSLHTRIRGLLGFLEETIHARTEVAIDVISFEGNPSLPATSVMGNEAAEHLIAQGAGTGRHRSHRVSLMPHRATSLDVGVLQPLLFDYNVEVAQAGTITDPVVGVASIGTQLQMRAAPAKEGLYLAVVLSRAEPFGALENRSVDMHSMIRSEGGVEFVPQSSLLQNQNVLSSSFAFDTLLREGQALVLRTGLDLERVSRQELVILRLQSSSFPGTSRYRYDKGEGAEVTLIHTGTVAPPRTLSGGQLVKPSSGLRGLTWTMKELRTAPLLHAQLLGGDDRAVQAAGDITEELYLQHLGSWMALAPRSPEAELRKRSVAERKRIEDTLAALEPSSQLLQMEARLMDLATGKTVVSQTLPVRVGESCSFAAGIEGMDLATYFVEVAQEACSPDSVIQGSFDGLALWVRPSMGATGNLVVDVRGGAHIQRGARERVDLGSRCMPFVDQALFDHLSLDERLSMRATGEGWSASFGAHSGDRGLRLDLSFRR